jgi:FtsH-binding integral membrane protein
MNPYYVRIDGEGEGEEGGHHETPTSTAGNLAVISAGYYPDASAPDADDDDYYYRGLYDNVRTPLVLWGMCNAIPLCTASLLALFRGVTDFFFVAAWAPFALCLVELSVIIVKWNNMSRAIQFVVFSWIELLYFIPVLLIYDDMLFRIIFGAWVIVFHGCLQLAMCTKVKW